jgi:O-antigen/teichoic acid export membrane protein
VSTDIKTLLGTTLKILSANVSAGASLTIVALVAARALSIDAFADFSVISATALLISLVMDFGLGVAIIKRYATSQDPRYLSMFSTLRLLIFGTSIAIGALLWMAGRPLWGCALTCGSGANLWISMRTADQAVQDYRTYLNSSLMITALRCVLGLVAMLTGSAETVAAAIYVVPTVLLAVLHRDRYLEFEWASLPLVRKISGYAAATYLSGLAFVTCLYVPQYFIALRFTPIDIGEYGLILSLTGPLTLVTAALRAYLLPRFARGGAWLDQFGGARRLLQLVVVVVLSVTVVVATVAYGLNCFYALRYPEIGARYLLFMFFFGISTMLALFNVRVHEAGIPGREAVVNAGRLLFLLGSLMALAHSLWSTIWIVSVTITAFEVMLVFVVWSSTRKSGRAAGSPGATPLTDTPESAPVARDASS